MAIKVLHLRSSTGIFGAEQVIINHCMNGDVNRFAYQVACFSEVGDVQAAFVRRLTDLGIPCLQLPDRAKVSPTNIRFLREYVRRENIAIVHSHEYKSNFYNYLANRGTRALTISTMHGNTSDSLKMKMYNLLNDRVVIFGLDGIIAVSNHIGDLLEQGYIPAKKRRVIINGIDPRMIEEKKHQCDGEAIHVSEKTLVLGVVGRMIPDKGHRFLLEALSKIQGEIPAFKVLLIGDGPSRSAIQQQAQAAGLADRVEFTGVRYDVDYLLNRIDIFILPSLTEGTPISMLEAMLMSKPVLVTRVGQIPRIIEDGLDGCLVPPGDVEALSKALKRLCLDAEFRTSLGLKARQKILHQYTAKIMAQHIETFYDELMSRQTGR